METFEKVEGIFTLIVNYLILFVELIGIIILIYSIVSAVIGLFKRQQHVRLKLAEGIALSLEFKMGGELLRTVIVREWKELLILGAIILMRAALTFLIQWEIKIERKNGNLSESELRDIKTPLTQNIKTKYFKFLTKHKNNSKDLKQDNISQEDTTDSNVKIENNNPSNQNQKDDLNLEKTKDTIKK